MNNCRQNTYVYMHTEDANIYVYKYTQMCIYIHIQIEVAWILNYLQRNSKLE